MKRNDRKFNDDSGALTGDKICYHTRVRKSEYPQGRVKPKFALSLRVINFIGDLIMMSGVFVAQTKFYKHC